MSETGVDDLVSVRRIFGSASAPEANNGLAPSAAITQSFGMSAVRSINDSAECTLDGNGNLANCGRLDGRMYWAKQYNLNMHVVVGQTQPSFIGLPGSQWGAGEWDRYQAYAEKIVRYVSLDYDGTGFPEALFEVGNELDIDTGTAGLWTLANPSVPQGDATRYEHYMRIYRVWSRAVDKVARENPSRRVLIGGPAMGGQGLFLNGAMWHGAFVRNIASEGLRLDVLTHHFYGDAINGWSGVPGSGIRAQVQTMRSALQANGKGNVPVFITEWGQSDASDRINYAIEGGAWAARFLQEALAGGARGGSYLLMRDVFGADSTGNPRVPSFTYVKDNVDYAKPATNVFRMFAKLPGTRVGASTPDGQSQVRAIASASSDSAGVLVSNYGYDFASGVDRSTAQTLRVGFTNLPFSGTVMVERYLLDENTSSVAKYIDAGQTPVASDTELAKVEQYTATVTSGQLLLDARSLARSGVSLWVIRRQ